MKIVAKNKRGTYDYAIDERIVAGLVLSGPEVKSAKAGEISLKGSYVSIRGGEAYLVNAHIRKYANSSLVGDYDPTRPRKLLVHKKQLAEIVNAKHANVQAVPLAVGISRGLVKLEIGLGRGQKKYDKRNVIKARQTLRDMAREIKTKK
jgi:SsrA-binding protein